MKPISMIPPRAARSLPEECYNSGCRLKPRRGGSAMAGNAALYDEDFYAWSMEQARLLRGGEFARLDIENIAEELESMGRRDRREIESRLVVLLAHLLRWQVQVGFRSRSWSATIREHRRRIERLVRESPSLRPAVDELLGEAFAEARERAAHETGFAETAFPEDCLFTGDQVLAADLLPEG
jgi:hypothetical protein